VRATIEPGQPVGGDARVPGDKSVAHRWLILAATARGRSRIAEAPPSLDVTSTARCLAVLAPSARPGLDVWLRNARAALERGGSTWNVRSSDRPDHRHGAGLEVEGDGRDALRPADGTLDCGNSGTTMRLLAGVLAASPFPSTLVGDASLSRRPMERVASPLRRMGAEVATDDGHAPLTVRGAALRGIRHEPDVPSAQVKGAVLLAGIAADGVTTVVERVGTRDHTERALGALGAPVEVEGGTVRVERFQHAGFEGEIPGDPSSAAYLVAAAAVTGARTTIGGVGLNPSRTRFLEVMRRMGVPVEARPSEQRLGEPVGEIHVGVTGGLTGVRVETDELPLVIDEVPVLAALAAHARGPSRFVGAAELRVKESDRLAGLAAGLRELGADAAAEGDDLAVGGGGLRGGVATSLGDHRLAMAFVVAGLAADAPVAVTGVEAADVSFPGFVTRLRALGASIEVRA
jgi:3-phosphoshikimate 1-carboxyvinyltransferase